MSKFLTALLVLAVLVWSAANAPGWSLGWGRHGADTTAATAPAATPAQDPIVLAALDTPNDLDIAAWLDRTQQELGTQWSAWTQHDAIPVDTSFAPDTYAGRRYGGGASGDALQAANVPGAAQFVDFGRFGPSMGGYAGGSRGGSHTPPSQGGKQPGSIGNPSTSNPDGSPSTGTDNGKPPKTLPTDNSNPNTNPGGSNPPGTNPPVTTQPEIPSGPGNGNPPTVNVPEPGTVGLLGMGLLGLALSLSRRRRTA